MWGYHDVILSNCFCWLILFIYLFRFFRQFYGSSPLPAPFSSRGQLQTPNPHFLRYAYRSSHPEVFLEKSVPKRCSKFTGEHPCQSVISIKSLCNFIESTLRHGCSPVNLLHIFSIPSPKNTSGRLLLQLVRIIKQRF